MNPTPELDGAESLVAWIAKQTEGLTVPDNVRNRIAYGLFHLAAEHHQSIVFLVREELYGSALALVRPLLECYVRGIWVLRVASEVQVERFRENSKIKKLKELIAEVEKHPGYSVGYFADIEKYSLSALHEYTHGGIRQVVQRINMDSIVSNYSRNEIKKLLSFSGQIGLLVATELIVVTKNDVKEREVLFRAIIEKMNSLGV
jgi:hypothetical protein